MIKSYFAIKPIHLLLILTGCLLAIVGLYRLVSILPYVLDPKSDFYNYYHAARLILAKESIYSFSNMHSPSLCLFFVPLALLPYNVSALTWATIIIIMYFIGGFLIFYEYKIPLTIPWLVLLIGLALSWYPFLIHVLVGQVNIAISLLIILAWVCMRKKKDIGGGIFLGIACMLKLFPGLFIIYLILQKKWKALLSMIISILITMFFTIEAIGSSDVLHFFTTVITKDSSFWIAYPLNLSLESTVYFLFMGGEQIIPLIQSRLLTLLFISILDFALLALLIWQIHKLPSTPLGNDLAYNAVIIGMLLLSPIIWQHIYPILLLMLILLLKLFLEEKDRIYLRIGVISFLLLSLPIHELLPFITRVFGSDRIPWYAALMLQVPNAGVMLLWFSIWFITRRSKNLYIQVQDN